MLGSIIPGQVGQHMINSTLMGLPWKKVPQMEASKQNPPKRVNSESNAGTKIRGQYITSPSLPTVWGPHKYLWAWINYDAKSLELTWITDLPMIVSTKEYPFSFYSSFPWADSRASYARVLQEPNLATQILPNCYPPNSENYVQKSWRRLILHVMAF